VPQLVRNVSKYRDAAMIEIRILKDLRKTFDEAAPFVAMWDWSVAIYSFPRVFKVACC
jgi:hypothetical protein